MLTFWGKGSGIFPFKKYAGKASIKLLMKMVGQSAEVLFRTHYVMRIRTWVIGMVQLRLRSMDTSLVLNIILVEDELQAHMTGY